VQTKAMLREVLMACFAMEITDELNGSARNITEQRNGSSVLYETAQERVASRR